MALLTVESGLFAGRTFNSVQELLAAQGTRVRKCKHAKRFRKVESGICGKGERTRAWVRIRCINCDAVLEDYMTSTLKKV